MGDSQWMFQDWLRLAVKVLRLSPQEFWAMSVCDFMTLHNSQSRAPRRQNIDALMRQFPDATREPSQDIDD